MLFSPILRHRALPMLISKASTMQKLSLPSVTGKMQHHQHIAERAMAGTAQSQTSAVRMKISSYYLLKSKADYNCCYLSFPYSLINWIMWKK